jgi:hypothetical protein
VSPSVHNKKARIVVRNFIKKPKEERTIEFDPLGVPTRSNMNVFQVVLSYEARETLGCAVHSWKKVPQTIKEAMWKDVKVQNELYNVIFRRINCVMHLKMSYKILFSGYFQYSG